MNFSNNSDPTSTVRQAGFHLECGSKPQKTESPFDGFLPMRAWQKEAFDEFQDNRFVILNAPMGSGKSKMMCFLSTYRLMQDPNLRCIITVPQTIIASGFIQEKLLMPNGRKIVWEPKYNLCEKSANKGTVAFVAKWLSEKQVLLSDRILLCTHATIASVYKKLCQKKQQVRHESARPLVAESATGKARPSAFRT